MPLVGQDFFSDVRAAGTGRHKINDMNNQVFARHGNNLALPVAIVGAYRPGSPSSQQDGQKIVNIESCFFMIRPQVPEVFWNYSALRFPIYGVGMAD
ncbi:MAG: hypothetical protein CL696_00595 [Chloroflexi bacterium]|nr:hypothetical protein [Chloroflexota bacterium]MDP6499070.1 hypothetical protein [Dehalococcoidia bacterium]MQG55757.1 hypothetical protein [SAR202 cluster bacterium]